MSLHFQRALVLVEQSRYDLAEKELRLALAEEPSNSVAHALLAQCLSEREQWDAATAEAKEAVRLAPDLAFAFLVLAEVYQQRNRLSEAEDACREAIRIDPTHAGAFATLASICYGRQRWEQALEAAEKGLEQDAEHIGCNNLRAMALTKLGRNEEARQTLAAALARDPEDSLSHTNQGWSYLHQSDSKKALEHFREALRLDPTNDYARAGMVEALKSRHLIYGLMLRYFLWMSRLGQKVQWGVILGAFILYQILLRVAINNPDLEPWLLPVLVLYIAYAVMTWIAVPLFNLLLRFNKYGRHALTSEQKLASTCVGLLFAPALTSLIVWLITDYLVALMGLVYFGLLLLPVSSIFGCEPGWPRRWMIAYTCFLAILFPLHVALLFVNEELSMFLLRGFGLGSFLSGFVANFLIMRTVRR